jgi:hypothetical protein
MIVSSEATVSKVIVRADGDGDVVFQVVNRPVCRQQQRQHVHCYRGKASPLAVRSTTDNHPEKKSRWGFHRGQARKLGLTL